MTENSRSETSVDPRLALELWRGMLRIRLFEQRLETLVGQGRVGGTTHLCIGQEAVPVGVSSLLDVTDLVVSNHRGHGHLLAKGARTDRAMAEIAGRATGYCKGKGGSQHVAVPPLGHMGSNGITGGGIPIAVGLALAQDLRGTGRCVVSYIGDGACNTGNFHESLNLAALWRLPIVFVVENNLYAMSTPVSRTSACDSFADWAVRYKGMAADTVDGNDVLAVRAAFAGPARRAREGRGPTLLECRTYRQSGHSKSDARVYRSREEEAEWAAHDPLEVLALQAGLDEATRGAARAELEAEIDAAERFAMDSPAGDLSLALSDLEVLAPGPGPAPMAVPAGGELTMTEALRETLRGEMRRDPSVVLIGEDIGVYGGAFGVTRGLLGEFGERRVRETPISESSFVGMSVGASAGGLRPVCELMFGDFLACCMDSLVNHGAKFRYMYADTIRTPFTLRMPVGRRRGYGGTHSQSLEAWLTHVPGLVVLFPATVEDAVGLLRSAIRSDSPVCFLEHKLLYPSKGPLPASDALVPIGRARIDREGEDLTLVTWGHCLGIAREAASMLEARGHSTELIDLRSLAPYDREAVLASVRKTGRLLIVQEAVGVGGFCDRILADVGPEAFPWLHAPPTKVAGLACPMPSSPELEELVVPDLRAVFRAAVELCESY